MGPFELLILLFIIFLVLGPKRITALFRSLGRGARDFTEEIGSGKSNDESADETGRRELLEEEDETQRKK